MTLLAITLFILALGALSYIRVSLLTFSLLAAFLLADLLIALKVNTPTAVLIFGVVAGVLLFFNIKPLRRHLLSAPIFAIFKKLMPPISETERQAIDAGDTWWEREIMSGKPNFAHLFDLPKPSLSEEEQAFLEGPVNELCSMIDDWQITHELTDLPDHMWDFLKEEGFFGLIIPKSYGGKDFSAYAHSEILARVAAKSISAAVTISVPNSLGPAELLIKYGTQAQRDHYLPRLARGEEIPCFALTGPNAGSDAGAIPDTGIVCKGTFEGKEVVGIRLNWNKRYITLAPVATILGLAFKLHDPEHLLGDKDHYGITCALIPVNTPGITIGRRHYPLNVAFQNGPTQGNDVFIPMDYIIGGQAMAGQGWRMLMECLSAGRAISLPSTSAGPCATAALASGAYARIRKQFNVPIGYFEGVEEALARIGGYAYLADATRRMTAAAIDLGIKPAIAGAICKYHVTELARKVSLDVMDVHGGKGICMGRKNYVARFYQAMPIGITVEGANILTRSLIIFGQGSLRCHPYLLKEMLATQESNKRKGLKDFDNAFWGHAGFILSNFTRTIVLSLTHGKFTHLKKPRTIKQYYQHISRLSAALAFTTDVTLAILGGELKRKEKLSARLGDTLSHLYMTSAILKRFQDEGQHALDLPFVHWTARYALHQAEFHLHRFWKNFPNRIIANLMHMFIFPFGMHVEAPDDSMGHKLARHLMHPNDSRDRLGANSYLVDDGHNNYGLLETALEKCLRAEPIEKKMAEAIRKGELDDESVDDLTDQALKANVISAAEAAILREANDYRDQIVAVDDFPGFSTLYAQNPEDKLANG